MFFAILICFVYFCICFGYISPKACINMKNDPINASEIAHIELEATLLKHELSKTVHSVCVINSRRLTYFLIETRRSVYKENGIKKTLKNVLDEFDVEYHTYYNWREQWYLLLPHAIRKHIR